MSTKKVLISLALVPVAIVAGLAAVLALTDVERYRDLLAGQVEAATGRKLDIAGRFGLRVFSLSPALVAGDVRFANVSWGSRPEMATATRIEAEISLLALLGGDLVINQVVLVEPDILLETNASGVGNWLLGPDWTEDKPASEDDVEIPTVERARIERARLTYRDGATGRVRQAEIAEIRLHSTGDDERLRLAARGAFDGKAIKLDAVLGTLATLAAADEPWPVDIAAEIGATRMTGQGSVALLASPVRLRLELAADRFDLREFVDSYEDQQSGRVFAQEPFALAALQGLDAEVGLTLGTFVGLTNLAIEDVTARATVKQGTLRLEPMQAQVGGAPIVLTATLTGGETARLQAHLRLRGADLGLIVREMTGDDTLTGALDAELKLSGTGRSVAEVMASANGFATLLSREGQVRSTFFDFLSADVVDAIKPWAPPRAPTRLRCAVMRFDIRDGIGRSKVIVIDSSRATVVGEGVINLRRETLDVLFEPSTKDLSVLSVAALVPIRAKGRLADPTFAPAGGAAVTGAAKSALGSAADAARWVGSKVGVSRAPGKRADPCPRARAVAVQAGAAPQEGAGTGEPKGRRKTPDKGIVDKIKGLFD
ncbi:MAG: AsmA family protein [Alphaproteobacteria bacterium]|nr:AsmA family protein [Alphaproteobacteria bacterium]